jgi:hypothetical protein
MVIGVAWIDNICDRFAFIGFVNHINKIRKEQNETN